MDTKHSSKNWIQRNWKWALPSVGCLSIIIVFALLFGAMVTKVTDMFKDSVPYSVGMETLRKNELAIEKLGEPIDPNGMFKGNINYQDNNGSADLKIPVKGPYGEAELLVIAEKKDGNWTYLKMEVTFNASEERINLLEGVNFIE